MKFDFIKIEKIEPNRNNPRRVNIPEEDPKLSYLKDSIGTFGVLVPVVVTPKGGRFLLVDGERRYHAAKAVGLQKLPAFILSDEDGKGISGKELLVRMFQIHHLREEWGPIQECAALEQEFQAIVQRPGVRQLTDEKAKVKAVAEELRAATGIEERTALDRIKFLRWPDSVKNPLYNAPDPAGYWYICEIEDKIIIPALCNYPEYFKHVDVDQVREDLFGKLEIALARSVEVRRVAPYFRATFSKASDRQKVCRVLKRLQTNQEMTYEEAEEELKFAFPDLHKNDPPTPRRMVTMLANLESELASFDLSAIVQAKRRARASSDELIDAARSLQSTIERFIERVEKGAP